MATFDDHLPLYSQAESYARDGVDLDAVGLGGRDRGRASPPVDLLRQEVIAGSDVLHGDDTPVPIRAPNMGRT